MTAEDQQLFEYEYPLNIDTYEAKTRIGLSINQAMIIMGTAMLPMFLLPPSMMSLVLGAALAIVAWILLSPFDRLGGMNIPSYLFVRVQTSIQKNKIEIVQIMPSVEAEVTRLNYARDMIRHSGKSV